MMGFAEKQAFSSVMLDKMRCPHCGAGEAPRKPLKPLKKTRGLYQPKRRSMDTSDYPMPTLTLHDECQKRLHGNIAYGTVKVDCDGCPSSFNCLTGNIDDGLTIEEDKAKRVEEAKKKVAEEDRKKETLRIKKVESGLCGFSCSVKNGVVHAKFAGTIWKLSSEDEKAILENTWNTEKTKIIKATLDKRQVDLSSVIEVLKWKLSSL